MSNIGANPADICCRNWAEFLPEGDLYESEFGDILRDHFGENCRSGSRRFKKTVHTDLDTKQGTDFIVQGVRIDVTTKPLVKKGGKIYLLRPSYGLGGGFAYIDYGLRLSNGHRDKNGREDGIFDQPVLVLRLRSGLCGWLPRSGYVHDQIYDLLDASIEDALEWGMDLFWTKCDRLGLEF